MCVCGMCVCVYVCVCVRRVCVCVVCVSVVCGVSVSMCVCVRRVCVSVCVLQVNNTLSIPHTFPLRTAITRILATDRDAGQNAALVYSCASANDSGLFGMDPSTGDLLLQRYMSRRQVGLYILRVAAHDQGTPQLSNQTVLLLDVYFDNRY